MSTRASWSTRKITMISSWRPRTRRFKDSRKILHTWRVRSNILLRSFNIENHWKSRMRRLKPRKTSRTLGWAPIRTKNSWSTSRRVRIRQIALKSWTIVWTTSTTNRCSTGTIGLLRSKTRSQRWGCKRGHMLVVRPLQSLSVAFWRRKNSRSQLMQSNRASSSRRGEERAKASRSIWN